MLAVARVVIFLDPNLVYWMLAQLSTLAPRNSVGYDAPPCTSVCARVCAHVCVCAIYTGDPCAVLRGQSYVILHECDRCMTMTHPFCRVRASRESGASWFIPNPPIPTLEWAQRTGRWLRLQ